MLDSGVLKIYRLVNVAENGFKPVYNLEFVSEEFYEERTIGVTRYYAALGANERIDMVARIWENRNIGVDYIASTEQNEQYRITLVQHTTDDDGLRVSDLTLERIGNLYDVN